MSEEQLKAFLEKVKGDASLLEKLKTASDAEAVVAIAKEAGFSIFVDDTKEIPLGISDLELEGIAGGTDKQTCALGFIQGVCTISKC